VTPALPEGYTAPADKAASERIVRLLVALGNGTACVAARRSDGPYEVQCFVLRGGSWLRVDRHCCGQTEQDAIAVAEADVRDAASSFVRQLREAAEASLNSVKQQLVEVAARLAKADALDSALKEQ
jgi:hypothetical protein